MKQPRFRVQARRTHVIRHPDVRPKLAKCIKGPALGRPRIRRREHAQLTSALAMVAKGIEQGGDTAPADESHDKVDAIG
jgi:hypothetical protein